MEADLISRKDKIRQQLLAEQEVLRSLRRAASLGHQTQTYQVDGAQVGIISSENVCQHDGIFGNFGGAKSSETKYNMGSNNRSQCIIFDAEEKGSASNLKTLFQNLNFDASIVSKGRIWGGLKIGDMVKEVENAVRGPSRELYHKNAYCFILAFLIPNTNMKVADVLSKVLEPVKSCKELFGKPKIILIQAANERDLDAVSDGMQCDSVEIAPVQTDSMQPKSRIPKEADFLYIFSTPPEKNAYRDSRGSCFIQALTDVLHKADRNQEIHQILTRVNRYLYDSVSRRKQVASFASMLTKELYIKL